MCVCVSVSSFVKFSMEKYLKNHCVNFTKLRAIFETWHYHTSYSITILLIYDSVCVCVCVCVCGAGSTGPTNGQ